MLSIYILFRTYGGYRRNLQFNVIGRKCIIFVWGVCIMLSEFPSFILS